MGGLDAICSAKICDIFCSPEIAVNQVGHLEQSLVTSHRFVEGIKAVNADVEGLGKRVRIHGGVEVECCYMGAEQEEAGVLNAIEHLGFQTRLESGPSLNGRAMFVPFWEKIIADENIMCCSADQNEEVMRNGDRAVCIEAKRRRIGLRD